MKILIKVLKISAVIVGLILVLDAGLILTFANWQPTITKADSVIILGAAINTPALTNRTLTALYLYQDGKADSIVLSGGKIADADISEAQFMQKVINRNTADPINYILEDQSHTTYENIKNSKAKIGDEDSIIIVSDKFHLARAFLVAKRAGFETVQWASPQPDYYSKQDLHYYYIREFVAIISYIPKFIFG